MGGRGRGGDGGSGAARTGTGEGTARHVGDGDGVWGREARRWAAGAEVAGRVGRVAALRLEHGYGRVVGERVTGLVQAGAPWDWAGVCTGRHKGATHSRSTTAGGVLAVEVPGK